VDRFDRVLLLANRWLVIVILAAMAIMVFANVVLRYATDHSIEWVEEVSRYLMIWLTFLGAGLVLRYGGHIGIDTLQKSFPRYAVALRFVILAIVIAFCGVLTWLGVVYADRTWAQTTPMLQIPVGFVYAAMPAGFLLLLLHAALMARPYVTKGEVLVDADFDPDAAASL